MRNKLIKVDVNQGGIIKIYENYTKYLINFKIIDNKLYIYNSFIKEEYRNYIEVKRINGKNVKRLIQQGLTTEDLLNNKRIKQYGIDITKKYVLTLVGYGKFNLLKDNESKLMLEQTYKKSKLLKVKTSKKFKETSPTNNPMLDYASTAYKSLLNSLYNLSLSDKDKKLFETLIEDIKNINSNYNNINTSMNIAYLSTALLLNDSDYKYIPEFIIKKFENAASWGLEYYQFVDKIYITESNNAVVTNGKIDSRKVIIMTRNAIAHSNYEVINDEYIRVFNEGKDKFNLYMPIKTLLFILKEINSYYTLHGFYPTVTKEFNELETISKDTIDDFLKCLEIHLPSKMDLRHYDDEELNDTLDTHLKLDVSNARMELNYLVFSDTNKDIFKRYIYPHLEQDTYLQLLRVDESLAKYIKEYIEMTDSDYFYNQISRSSQEEIIANIIRQKINKKTSYFNQVLDSIMINNELGLESFTTTSRSYITYLPQIELTILSLLNILFCYSHNHNKKNIDTKNMRFPRYFYEDELMSKVDKLRQIATKKVDIKNYIEYLLRKIPGEGITREKIDKEIKYLEQLENKVVLTIAQVDSINAILDGRANENQHESIHEDILTRLRDAIAHGRVPLSNINIYDIGSTKITFIDTYNDTIEFIGTITLRDLLTSISKEEIMVTSLNDNKHFKNHILHLTPSK